MVPRDEGGDRAVWRSHAPAARLTHLCQLNLKRVVVKVIHWGRLHTTPSAEPAAAGLPQLAMPRTPCRGIPTAGGSIALRTPQTRPVSSGRGVASAGGRWGSLTGDEPLDGKHMAGEVGVCGERLWEARRKVVGDCSERRSQTRATPTKHRRRDPPPTPSSILSRTFVGAPDAQRDAVLCVRQKAA